MLATGLGAFLCIKEGSILTILWSIIILIYKCTEAYYFLGYKYSYNNKEN